MKTVITSFSIMTTAEGDNVSFTYSVIDENGNKVAENVRQSLVLVDEEQIIYTSKLKEFLLTKVKA